MYVNVVRYLIRSIVWDESDDIRTFQAKIFLLQSIGLPLGNRFIWSHGHPVSDDLSLEEFDTSIPIYINEKFYIDKEIEEKIKTVNALSEYAPKDIELYQWYEMLAGLVYILNDKKSYRIMNEDCYDAIQQKTDIYLCEKQHFEMGINILKEQGFIPSSIKLGGNNEDKYKKNKRSGNRFSKFAIRRK